MGAVRAFLYRVGGVAGNRAKDREFAEEIEFHLQMEIADNLLRGMTPVEARRLALVKSGGLELAREAYRERLRPPFIVAIGRDFRYALRTLSKSPVFTAVVVTTLAVCIGANTALFSLVDAVLLRPLPYGDADRLTVMGPAVWASHMAIRAFSDAAICTRDSPVTLSGSVPEHVDAAQASANLFSVLGVTPLLGRSFRVDGEAVISYDFWQRWFHGAPDVVGQTLIIDGHPSAVAGVMPRTFQFPSRSIQLWRLARGQPYSLLIGRLRPGTTLEQAQSGMHSRAIPIAEQIAGKPIQVSLWSLFGAVSLVLLIACGNVSNLLLARGAQRHQELAVRSALGASRRRLMAQLMVENAMLCAAAGACGMVLASFGLRALIAFAPAGTPRIAEVGIDGRVLGFTVLISFLCTLLFGLLPAFETTRSGSLGRSRGPHGQRMLIVCELAMALVLLCGAGLMLRSLAFLRQVPLGFDASHTLTFRVSLPANWDDDRQAEFYAEALQRIRNLPAVTHTGAISNLSLTYNRGTRVDVEGSGSDSAMDDAISPDFFAALRVPLMRGRFFSDADNSSAPPVALVNETFAARTWPHADAVGKRLRLNGAWLTVVGVAGDMRRSNMEKEESPQIFRPLAQAPNRSVDFVVRTAGEPGVGKPGSIDAQIRGAFASLDARVPLFRVSALEKRVVETLVPRRFETGLLSLFAAIALFLAAVGIYGVMHYWVAQRSNEIGIRMASGATPRDVLSMVLSQGLRLAGIGIAAGLAGVFLVNGIFLSLPLVGVTATDPVTFGMVAGLLGGVAALACAIPAWRAATVDPVLALRHE